jgi:prepilin-type N-terminal cleavage/methylation domain-containing protein
MRTIRKESGFSLLELMIVIAIIAILAAITVPNVLSWLPGKRLRYAADELYGNLQYAKMMAIKNNEKWAVYYDFSGNSYKLIRDYGGSGQADFRTVDLDQYGSGVRYGTGDATQSVPGGSITSALADGNSYDSPDDTAVFDSQGTADNLGYVYLRTDGGATIAVGTPSLAGIVVQRGWSGTGWE